MGDTARELENLYVGSGAVQQDFDHYLYNWVKEFASVTAGKNEPMFCEQHVIAVKQAILTVIQQCKRLLKLYDFKMKLKSEAVVVLNDKREIFLAVELVRSHIDYYFYVSQALTGPVGRNLSQKEQRTLVSMLTGVHGVPTGCYYFDALYKTFIEKHISMEVYFDQRRKNKS